MCTLDPSFLSSLHLEASFHDFFLTFSFFPIMLSLSLSLSHSLPLNLIPLSYSLSSSPLLTTTYGSPLSITFITAKSLPSAFSSPLDLSLSRQFPTTSRFTLSPPWVFPSTGNSDFCPSQTAHNCNCEPFPFFIPCLSFMGS